MHSAVTFAGGRRDPLRALIFDMDGTIADTRAYHMAAWRQLVARLGLDPRHYQAAERGFGKTNWAIFNEWFHGQSNGYDFDALSEEKETLFRQLIQGKEKVRPGFMELVSDARQAGLRIALATSGPQSNARFLLRDLGISRFFDVVLWGDAAIRGKPHPDPFLKAARRLGLPPQQCVAFEDSTYGFLSVLRANMKLIAIAERPADLSHLRQWTPFIFRDFTKVPDLLVKWM